MGSKPLPRKRWWGVTLDGLREDYERAKHPVAHVAKKHGTSAVHLYKLVKKHGWEMRNAKTNHPRLGTLKIRKRVLKARIAKYQKQLTHLESKISFMETLNR